MGRKRIPIFTNSRNCWRRCLFTVFIRSGFSVFKIKVNPVNCCEGSKVDFIDDDLGELFSYEIVGTTEADFKAGKISNESPIGKALIGKRVGEIATVEAPASSYGIRLEKVSY